jgi:hypothetical protein
MCLVYHNVLAVHTELMVRPVATADSASVTGCYASYTRYDELEKAESRVDEKALKSSSSSSILIYAEEQLDHILHMKTTWLVFLIISSSLLGIILLMVIYLRSRIRIAVSLIKEASK